MQANVAAQVVPATPSPLQTPSVPAEPGAAPPVACTEAVFGKGPSSVLTVAPMAKTTGTTVFGQPATSTPAAVSTALSFALGSATTPFASPVFGSQVATTSSQSPAQTGTAVTTPAFSQASHNDHCGFTCPCSTCLQRATGDSGIINCSTVFWSSANSRHHHDYHISAINIWPGSCNHNNNTGVNTIFVWTVNCWCWYKCVNNVWCHDNISCICY
ncbi:hypothetical protein MTO96_019918 [Rhipicephalus appendiculatus]